ncbi:hypothetical protein BC831DRAFT_395364, partial [Entophlyctis helioformis]
ITTRIYIEDARSFKTLVLTSLMSAEQVVHDVVERFRLEPSPDWALFELCNDTGIERPLRDWEIVTDIISAWDLDNSLNAISLNGRFPRVQGYLYLELKPGKWQKRFCVLKDSFVYYYQEANRRKQMPTEFCFAVRSVNSVAVFENKNDYCKFVCVEKRERLYDWVLALRLARVSLQAGRHGFDPCCKCIL